MERNKFQKILAVLLSTAVSLFFKFGEKAITMMDDAVKFIGRKLGNHYVLY